MSKAITDILKEAGIYKECTVYTSTVFHILDTADKLMSRCERISKGKACFRQEFKQKVLGLKRKTAGFARFIDITIEDEDSKDKYADDLDFMSDSILLLFTKGNTKKDQLMISSFLKNFRPEKTLEQHNK